MNLSKLFLLFFIFQLIFIEINARGGGGHSSGGGGHSSSSSGGSHVSAPTTSAPKPTTTPAPSTTPTKPTTTPTSEPAPTTTPSTTPTKPTMTTDPSSGTPTTPTTTKPTTTDPSSGPAPTTSTTKPPTTSGSTDGTTTIAGRRYVAVDASEYSSSQIQSSLNTGIGAVNQNLDGILPSRLGSPKINNVRRQEDVPTNYVYDVSLAGSRGFFLRTIFLVDATTSNVNVISYSYEYPTNVLEDILTNFNEENQESDWIFEYETYEFDEIGEFVGDGLIPINLDAAGNDQAVQDALNFGNAFVINRATKTGELGPNETQFKRLLAVSSKAISGGVEYEFHVEIGDPNVDEESEWMHVFFAVNVEASGAKEVTSYSVLTLFDTE